jgi:DNA-binding transcriptional regulator YdaS (Cro superfamily)
MNSLRTYLNTLPKEHQQAYALRCGTTINYLRKAISTNQRLGADLAVLLAKESGGAVTFDSIRPDVDWGYVRSTEHPAPPSSAA